MAFDPDAYLANQAAATPVSSNGFDPDAYLVKQNLDHYEQIQAKYGDIPNQIVGGAEALARVPTLGGSDWLLKNVAGVPTEDIRGREEANPVTNFIAGMYGAGAMLHAIPIAGAVEAGAAGLGAAPTVARVAGMATEGGLLGAGNIVSDASLGDVNINSEKIMGDIGTGMLLGGGLGLVSKGLESIPGLMKRSMSGAAEGFANAMNEAAGPSTLEGLANAAEGDIPIANFEVGKSPKTHAEMEKIVSDIEKYSGQDSINTAPGYEEYKDALATVGNDMAVPPTAEHEAAHKNLEAMLDYKTKAVEPGKAGEIRRKYNNAMKWDLNRLSDQYINEVAPGYEATENAAEAGSRVSDTLENIIKKNRDEVGKQVGEIKSTPVNDVNHLPGIVDYLTGSAKGDIGNPKLSNIFDTTGTEIKLKPYSGGMPVEEVTYNKIKSMVEGLKKDPTNFEDLWNWRKKLDSGVNMMEKGSASSELLNAKKAMMEYMEDTLQNVAPEMQVRDTMRKYAINEENANYLERKLGVDLGNWKAERFNKADESILKTIFRDSKSVQAIKDILPPEEFQKVLKDFLTISKAESTDLGVFSSNKFNSKIGDAKKGGYSLSEAFADRPELYKKLKAATNLARFIPDAKPINPSNTAPTLMKMMGDLLTSPTKYGFDQTVGFLKGKLTEAQDLAELNARLADQASKTTKLDGLQSILKSADKKLEAMSKKVFSNVYTRGAIAPAVKAISDKEFTERTEKIKNYASNDQAMIDHMHENVGSLSDAAPNITQSLQMSMVRGVNFLATKIPAPMNQMALSSKYVPSKAQKDKFNNYYSVVDNPMSALDQITKHTLTSETMEALQTVYPSLLGEMRQKLIGNFNPKKAIDLPYQTKINLAKFLGEPLDENMLPMSIMGYQSALMMSSQGQGPGRKKGSMKDLDLAGRTETQSNQTNAEET